MRIIVKNLYSRSSTGDVSCVRSRVEATNLGANIPPTLASSTCTPSPSHSSQHGLKANNTRSSSQQQLQKNLNEKKQTNHSQNIGEMEGLSRILLHHSGSKGHYGQVVKRFFIRLIAKTKKNTVTATSQTTLKATIKAGSKPKTSSTFPPITPRITLTMCVRGKITIAPI